MLAVGTQSCKSDSSNSSEGRSLQEPLLPNSCRNGFTMKFKKLVESVPFWTHHVGFGSGKRLFMFTQLVLLAVMSLGEAEKERVCVVLPFISSVDCSRVACSLRHFLLAL